jgi:hypothetical protein
MEEGEGTEVTGAAAVPWPVPLPNPETEERARGRCISPHPLYLAVAGAQLVEMERGKGRGSEDDRACEEGGGERARHARRRSLAPWRRRRGDTVGEEGRDAM